MKKTLITACLYTAITAVLFAVIYPLTVTAVAHLVFPRQASGQLLTRAGTLIGSHLIGQAFTGPSYFHSRPSAAGTGYDASSSSGSNLGPASKALSDRMQGSVDAEKGRSAVPVDLITASGSGLDPDISPAAGLYQVARIAKERHLSEESVRSVVQAHITPRQFGLLGEPRINALELNLALDGLSAQAAKP